MADLTTSSHEPTRQQSEIETLARETNMPVETVYKIYNLERARLDQTARIKTYVPMLVHRRVKELLQVRRAL